MKTKQPEAGGETEPGATGPAVRRGPSLGVFSVAFVLLLAAAAAIGWGQFSTNISQSHLAPWVSMGLSVAAVLACVVALVLRRR